MRIHYEAWKPGGDSQVVVEQARTICVDYAARGYDLTLRQLYYQFVARDLLPNTQQSYNRLGTIINKARMAGLLDWDYIEDRTRNLVKNTHWENPSAIMDGAARSYGVDLWANQPTRVEVWVEKEALAGVIGQSARRYDCAHFACRGYVSQSEMWAAGQRLGQYIENGQNVVILHLGDHDPSGIDMTRDIADRLETFTTQDYLNAHLSDFEGERVRVSEIRKQMAERCGGRDALEIRRIALNFDQVEEYDPPPNPAKLSDSRIEKYLERYGDESWELDALDPDVLDTLITDEVDEIVDRDLYDEAVAEQEQHRTLLETAASRWDDIVTFLNTDEGERDSE